MELQQFQSEQSLKQKISRRFLTNDNYKYLSAVSMTTFLKICRASYPVLRKNILQGQSSQVNPKIVAARSFAYFYGTSNLGILRAEEKDEKESDGSMKETVKETVGKVIDKVGQAMEKGKELKDRASEQIGKMYE